MLKQQLKPSIKRDQLKLRIVILFFFLIILIYLYSLQIHRGDYFSEIAEKNYVRISRINPLRGEIFDRNYRPLAVNIPTVDLYLTPANIKSREKLTEFLSDNFDFESGEIIALINRGRTNPFQEILLVTRVDYDQVLEFSEYLYNYPSLSFKTEAGRSYTNQNHFIGYTGKISHNELSRYRERGYNINSMIGKNGIERAYEEVLKGFYGYQVMQVDATGKSLELFKHNLEKPVLNGIDLILTVDLKLQEFIQQEFPQGKRGAVVVIDSQTGGILSYVSKPQYDPNLFTHQITRTEWDSLLINPDNPLLDRITQGTYAPASLFKVLTAAFALDSGIITRDTRGFYCDGKYAIGDRTFRCWFEHGHGRLNIVEAIKKSCNVHFYDLSLRLDLDLLKSYVDSNFIISRTGIDLPSERIGFFPDTQWYANRLGRFFTVTGQKAILSIGQGEVLVTPLQVAVFYNALANDGLWRQPFFVKDFIGRESREIFERLKINPAELFERETKNISMSGNSLKIIKESLLRGVRDWDGTGTRARVGGVKVYGKTGTAQNIGKDPHAWFAGFAKWDEIEITLVVFIENIEGGGGGKAAPLAGKIIEFYNENVRN